MNLFKKEIKDESEESEYRFLYTTSRQFPFDEVCDKIVRELQKRNYQVPGIEVVLDSYGSGNRKFRYVSRIKGNDFKIYFCRVQGGIDGTQHNDIAAPTEIHIPQKELNVYEDESGPTFYLYVGKDWESDKEAFMTKSKVHSKMDCKPRTYLRYSGRERYMGRRAVILKPDNDLGREYDPEDGEPTQFVVSEVFDSFTLYLENVVLKQILETPIFSGVVDIFQLEKPIMMPEIDYRILYLGNSDDYERILSDLKGTSKLSSGSCYGLKGVGTRLLSLGIKTDRSVSPVVYDGFGYCSLSKKDETNVDILFSRFVAYESECRDAKAVIEIKPKKANGFYVVDHAALLSRRGELMNVLEMEGRDTFTDAEVADFKIDRAKTIVPITEYKGDYEMPLIIFNRELDLDEVQILKLL